MLCNSVSYYPQKIDNMIFFQDNNLENIEIINYYNNLVAQGKYTEANNYINQQEGVYGFFADFFNLIENRIYNLQEYLSQKSLKIQPFMYFDKRGYGILIFSDLDEQEDLDTIKLFSSDEEDEEPINLETLYICNDSDSLEKLHIYDNDDNELVLEEIEPPIITNDTIWI